MNEEEYVELNRLLAKLRVKALKDTSDPLMTIAEKERKLKTVRVIDFLRKTVEPQIN